MPLAGQRCLRHPDREAVARCPECRRAYCRECVTEHDGRMLCAACIARLRAPVRAERAARGSLVKLAGRLLRGAGKAARLGAGVLAAWLFFHALGETLAMIPDATHTVGAAATSADDSAEPEDGE